MTLVLGALLSSCSPPFAKRMVRIPCTQELVSLSHFISGTVAVASCAVWAVFRSRDWAWILQDALGMCVVMLFIRTIRLPSLKASLVPRRNLFIPVISCYLIHALHFQTVLVHVLHFQGEKWKQQEA